MGFGVAGKHPFSDSDYKKGVVTMRTVRELVERLELLEEEWFHDLTAQMAKPEVKIPNIANGAVQFVAVESRMDAILEQSVSIILTIGINYHQGSNPHFNPAQPKHLSRWVSKGGRPSVVDGLSEMRETLDFALHAVGRNRARWEYESNPTGGGLAIGNVAMTKDCLLVATNLSPFITQLGWAQHSSNDKRACGELLALWCWKTHLGRWWEVLGNIDLLVCHGKKAVWQDLYQWRSQAPDIVRNAPWLFTYNLSRRGLATMKAAQKNQRWLAHDWFKHVRG